MKKRLTIIFIALAFVVLIIVLNSTVFTVQNAEVNYYSQNGELVTTPSGISANTLIEEFTGKNIFFLNEDKVIDALHENADFSDYFCITITREFPNTLVLNITQREPVFYMMYANTGYLIDSYGYCVRTQESSSGYIVISNFSTWINSISAGSNVTWNSGAAEKFDILCDVVNTVWRFNFNYSDINELVGSFAFDSENNLEIQTVSGAKIIIKAPSEDTGEKVVKAISVYYSDKVDNTTSATTIIVDQNKKVATEIND